MQGRKWVSVDEDKAKEIRKLLLERGGEEKEVKSVHELWRVRFSDSTFTYYASGTLYSTPSNLKDPSVKEAWAAIDEIAGSNFVQPSKEFLIGLDETGKGELIGHVHLVGAMFPSVLFSKLDRIASTADTKKAHGFSYWDELYREITLYIEKGLEFLEEKIPPWHVDKYNLNKIMDVVYQRILSQFFRKVDIANSRIVIDDYGIGPSLRRFLNFLRKQGAEIVVAKKSDDYYLEAKIASIIAKRGREAVIKAINENPEYQINGHSIGSGNAGDKQTATWLKLWYESGRQWPWFIRRSFAPIRKIEGRKEKIRKVIPPIKEDLLSKEFKEKMDQGKLDIRALSVVCPTCGVTTKEVLFTPEGKEFVARCPSCRKPIKNLNFTLRYYCGFIVPDSNVINRGLLGKDMERGRFFEDFTVIIPNIVRYECDTAGGKKEFERLGKFAAIGRIKLKEEGKKLEPKEFEGLSTQQRDDLIIDVCVKENAILLSADKQVKALAISRGVFLINVL